MVRETEAPWSGPVCAGITAGACLPSAHTKEVATEVWAPSVLEFQLPKHRGRMHEAGICITRIRTVARCHAWPCPATT